MKYNLGITCLNAALRVLYNRDDVARVLGVLEEKTDEFWEQQRRTVMHRFYSFLLAQLGLPQTLEKEALDLTTAARIHEAATAALDSGLTYETVRRWWLLQGRFLHTSAFNAEHERKRVENSRLSVLVFFEGSRPLWLGINSETHEPVLLEDKEAAHAFPVYSVTDLTPAGLDRAAENFKVLVCKLGATHVKVLPNSA